MDKVDRRRAVQEKGCKLSRHPVPRGAFRRLPGLSERVTFYVQPRLLSKNLFTPRDARNHALELARHSPRIRRRALDDFT